MTTATMREINMPGSGFCPRCKTPHLMFMPATDGLYCASCRAEYRLGSYTLVADLLNALRDVTHEHEVYARAVNEWIAGEGVRS